MSAARWCLGWPPERGPHIPDDGNLIDTLANYRLTALWVNEAGTPHFGWVDGFSFTAHNEARKAGLSYDEFAANPRTTDLARHLPPAAVKAARHAPEVRP